MQTLHLKVSEIFEKNFNASERIVVNQGGTRSGKTYSILQVLLAKALSDKVHISVCSLSLPHLKKGALRDWLDILNKYELYAEHLHNKTDNTFRIRVSSAKQQYSLIEFFSIDNPAKARGPGRDILFINEANLIPFETYKQLVLRTRKQIYLDFNPADEFHWIYDHVLNRDDVKFIKSTFIDNPFLPIEMRQEIERYRDVDENFWRVFGLGERGHSQAVIYTHWQFCEKIPQQGQIIYGLDFGFNNPTACILICIHDQNIFADEIIYQSQLTNSDLITKLKELKINKYPIYADAAEPGRIEEIRRAGFNIKPASKDVDKGIDTIKAHKLFITKTSLNLIKEIKSYKWQQDINEKVLDIPLKLNDHALDAMRYAVHTYFSKSAGTYALR